MAEPLTMLRRQPLGEIPYYCKLAMRPQRMALMVAAIVCAIEAVIMLVLPISLDPRIGPVGVALADALLLTALLVPCLWWIIVRPLGRIAECRQHLLEWALAGQERNAGRLSRDLHDGIGQFAAAINVGLATLEANTQDPQVIQRAQHLREIGRQLHDAIRDLSRGLRPRVLDDIGLAPAVTNYAAEMTAQHAVVVTASVADLERRRLPAAVETALFRIVQEGVTNAIRHAHARRIDVEMSIFDEAVHLTVTDDGQGFDPEAVFRCHDGTEKPFGLISIRERVLLLNGEVHLQSTRGRGTRLEVQIPLAAERVEHD